MPDATDAEARLLQKIKNHGEEIAFSQLSQEEKNLVRAMRGDGRRWVLYPAPKGNYVRISSAGFHALSVWEQRRREAVRETIRRQEEEKRAMEAEKRSARRSWLQMAVSAVLTWLLGWLSSVLLSPADVWAAIASWFG